MTVSIIITDHVVVRYMERQHDFPISAIRKEIEDKVRCAVAIGAKYLSIGDICFSFVPRPDGAIAVTTAMRRSVKNNHHEAQRRRRRRGQK